MFIKNKILPITNQAGYTLVELMLAMSIFGFVSVGMTTAIAHLIHLYQATSDIRATQQSARELSEQLTDEARQSLLITTPPYSALTHPNGLGTGDQPQTSICFFKTLTPLDDGNYRGSGDVYYTNLVGTNIWRLDEKTFTLNDNPVSACKKPITGGVSTHVSSFEVSFLTFGATVSPDGRLLQIDMVIAPRDDVTAGTNITYNTWPSLPVCIDGDANRYCSVTNLEMAAEAREGQ